jgi:hypothetical protein
LIGKPRGATTPLSIEQHPAPSRADRRARLLTPGFSLARHFGAFGAVAVTATAIGVWLARWARPSDLWIVPVYLVAANVAEYLMHRLLMHRPIWPRAFYRSHTLGHHRAFPHDSMEIETWPELELVIMPWFSLALFFVAMAPVVAAVGWAFGRGAAGLFLLTGLATFVLYEGMHMLYHVPASTLRTLRLADSRVFRFLHGHHIHHHRVKRMRWTNFNISMPLSDACFGTAETEASWRRARAEAGQTDTEHPPAAAGHDGKHAA